jgi:hypothetical protein
MGRKKKVPAPSESTTLAGELGVCEPVAPAPEEEYKKASISPFDFVNAIHYSKDQLIVDDWSEKQYNAFVINRALSFGVDTVIPANEMNCRPHVHQAAQFAFLINMVRPRKRYNKWLKAEKIENLEMVQQYYGFSAQKALSALSLLSADQLGFIKKQLSTGGQNA